MTNTPKPTDGLTFAGRRRTDGIRFSLLDAFVLAISFPLAMLTWETTAGFSLLMLFVVVHFFLFCNIFRIRRAPELIWATTFIAQCVFRIATGHVDLLSIAFWQCFITVVLLANELRMPCYHGVFARRINPRLDDYLAGRLDRE